MVNFPSRRRWTIYLNFGDLMVCLFIYLEKYRRGLANFFFLIFPFK